MEERAMRIGFTLFCYLIISVAFSSPALSAQRTFKSRPGEWVVRIKSSKIEGAFERIADRLGRSLGNKQSVRVRKFITSAEFATMIIAGQDASRTRLALQRDPEVAYAEPNYLYHALGKMDSVPNDAQFNALWGMKNTGQADAAGQLGTEGSDIHVSPVWAEGITGSRSIKVAVIDTGIDGVHPDLKANVDVENGFDFVNQTAGGADDHNHGTHCAGTIGALANNGVGVAGVNWNVTLIPVKFLDSRGSGTLENAVQSIQYATKLKVNIMSNSWGGGPFTQALYDAIEDAKKQGILFVAAAGNDSNNNDSRATYPAGYELDNVLSVAATDNRDRLAGFSNHGARTVHVAAPGVKILSTLKGGGYGAMSGTSMATPHVAGIAALILSTDPSLGYSQLKDLIIRSSDPVRGLSRKVISKGRVNVYNAIHRIFPVSEGPDSSRWQDVSYPLESAHPYENGKIMSYEVKVPGAKFLRVVFDQIDTESGYDFVEVKQARGEVVESISGSQKAYTSDYTEGESAEVLIRADSSVNKWGFKVSKVQAIY
jgi:hypothetical protein